MTRTTTTATAAAATAAAATTTTTKINNLEIILQSIRALNSSIALQLFLRVGAAGSKGIRSDTLQNDLGNNLRITRKQFYMRMALLTGGAGLIVKRSGLYRMTSYGKVLLYAISLLDKTAGFFWLLQVVDELNSQKRTPQDVKDKLIDSNISESTIKSILLLRDKRDLVLDATTAETEEEEKEKEKEKDEDDIEGGVF